MNSFAEFYSRLRARFVDNASRYDVAYFVFGNIFIEAGRDKLLHAQLDVSPFAINREDLRLNRLAGL